MARTTSFGPDFWDQLVRDFLSTTMTQQQFAADRAVNLHTFRRWLYRLRENDRNVPLAAEKENNSTSGSPKTLRQMKNRIDIIENYLFAGNSLRDSIADILQSVISDKLPEMMEDQVVKFVGERLQDDDSDILGLVRDRFESNLRESFMSMQDEFAGNYASMQEDIDLPIASYRSELDDLAQRVHGIEARLQKKKQAPPLLTQIKERIIRAQNRGLSLQAKEFRAPLTAAQLSEELRRNEFFLPEATSQEIIDKLERRKLLVLEGVPGTGKTRLAKLLPRLLLPGQADDKFTSATVHPEATSWNSIGGLRMIDRQFAPHFGWLSDSVLKAIESDGSHWLILDEINRGDVSALLGPALDALTPGVQGSLEHPNLFPGTESEPGLIPVPGMFRIIGTRNPFDSEVLFEFTHALERRVSIVRIPPLVADHEGSLIELVVVRRMQAELGYQALSIHDFKDEFDLKEALSLALNVVERIRSLALRDPLHLYQYCEIGTASVIEIARYICARCISGSADATLESIVDEAISLTLIDQMTSLTRQVLLTLRDEVFRETWAGQCRLKLERALSA